MAGISDPFAGFGPAAKAKFLILGSPDSSHEALMDRARSLNLEHVSPCRLKDTEISRRPATAAAEEAATLARMRRWYFARKPDAGFVLTDFPATLLQAKVFDEWLETRAEALDAIIPGAGCPVPVLEHYRTLGYETGLNPSLPA
ncbi:MAG: adenylate kinase [Verrucomicrobia bacterium]|nr:adenylate kinase [Verrucomicrobiota bacterium]